MPSPLVFCLLSILSLSGLLGRATSQPCLYNYTIGNGTPIIITTSDPVCLICFNTNNNMWAIGGGTETGISGAPYILYVMTPEIKFIGGPTVGCFSSGPMNLIASTVFIVVPAVPQVITYVNESDTLNLVCSKVMTASESAITLLGQSWMDPQRNTISNLSTYSLPFVNRTAAGNYTCVTKVVANANGVTNMTASTLVVVYYRPTIVSQNSSVYMVQDLSVQLNCTFDGIPVPKITWTYPNGSVVASQPRFLVQSTTTSTSLTISSPVVGMDNGTYTCSASNIRGMSSTTVQLFVQAPVPPDTPSNLVVTNAASSSISLSWTNGFNGYSPLVSVLISYEVDRYPQEGTRNQTFPFGTTATLIGLHSNSSYTIHVRLVNAAGLISNPANITQKTVLFTPSSSPTPNTTSSRSAGCIIQLCTAMWISYLCAVWFNSS